MGDGFFKESDCDHNTFIPGGPFEGGFRTWYISLDKANRLLKERGKVVYGAPEDGWMTKPPREGSIDDWHTHQALVINVTLITKDTAESLLNEILFERYEKGLIGPKEWGEFQDRAKRLKGESK